MAYVDRDIMQEAIRHRTEKRCRVCRVIKLLTEFHIDSSRADGHEYRCAACTQIVRGVGRPRGIRTLIKPPADILHPHTVRLTDAEWDACRDTGDASGFIRQAIKEKRGRPKGVKTVEPGA